MRSKSQQCRESKPARGQAVDPWLPISAGSTSRLIPILLSAAVLFLTGCATDGKGQSVSARIGALSGNLNRAINPVGASLSVTVPPYANSLAAALGDPGQRLKKYIIDRELLRNNRDSVVLDDLAVLLVLKSAGILMSSPEPDRPDATETRPGATETRPGATETRPGATETRPGATETRPVPRPGTDTGDWRWPVDAGVITSPYGARSGKQHRGMDIAGAIGEPIIAMANGEVVYSDNKMRGYGNVIVIKHADDMSTLYAHNDKLIAKVGDRVQKGMVVAYLGNTGRSTGPHVHFEIRQGRHALDPTAVLPATTLPVAVTDTEPASLFARALGRSWHDTGRHDHDQCGEPLEIDGVIQEALFGPAASPVPMPI